MVTLRVVVVAFAVKTPAAEMLPYDAPDERDQVGVTSQLEPSE